MLQVLLGIGLNMICVLARLTLLVTYVTNAQKASLDFHLVLQVSFIMKLSRYNLACIYLSNVSRILLEKAAAFNNYFEIS